MFDETEIKKGLKSITPKTKVGIIKQVMPDILKRLEDGIKLGEIIEILKSNGIEIGAPTLRNYIYRYRKTMAKKEVSNFDKAPVVSAKSETTVPEKKKFKDVLKAHRAGNVGDKYINEYKTILKGLDK